MSLDKFKDEIEDFNELVKEINDLAQAEVEQALQDTINDFKENNN